MDARFRAWAEEKLARWTSQLAAFEGGNLGTSEIRNGRHVNTTQQTISDLRHQVDEFTDILRDK